MCNKAQLVSPFELNRESFCRNTFASVFRLILPRPLLRAVLRRLDSQATGTDAKEKVVIKLNSGLIVLLISLLPAAAQDSLGTSFGVPNTTPSVSWPHGLSLESLGGINRLYPNGPEFGLANTSGGFGMIGSGPMSAVGLVQNAVSPLVRSELERPFDANKRLTDIFRSEAARSSALFSSTLGGPFRAALATGFAVQTLKTGTTIHMGISMPSVDSVLQDQPASLEAILNPSQR